MSDACKTVTINTPNGPVRINVEDHNPEIHGAVIADAVPTPAPAPVAATVTTPTIEHSPAPVYGVLEKKNKFFVVNSTNGEAVVHPNIEASGYASNKDAWEAIVALNTPPSA
jgi:hypothetical protein